jgi:hypothetical protein
MKHIFNEYIYRYIWINRCNDNYISNSDTDFHLVIPVDEINESCSLYQGLLSHLITGNNYEKRRQCCC